MGVLMEKIFRRKLLWNNCNYPGLEGSMWVITMVDYVLNVEVQKIALKSE